MVDNFVNSESGSDDITGPEIKSQPKPTLKSFIDDHANKIQQHFSQVATITQVPQAAADESALEAIKSTNNSALHLDAEAAQISQNISHGSELTTDLEKADDLTQSVHDLTEQEIKQTSGTFYAALPVEQIDPPATETAMAANVRHQKRQLRLEEQRVLRATLREQFATSYQIQSDMIADMKVKLQAEKSL